MRILIIDDEIEVAGVIADILSSEGHTTTLAHHGGEGLALLKEHRPDAVFLDVAMPDMSGIEVLRRIRSTDRALPVVLITGLAEPEQVDEARRLGVTDVIEKPFALKNLRQAVESLRSQESAKGAGRRSGPRHGRRRPRGKS